MLCPKKSQIVGQTATSHQQECIPVGCARPTNNCTATDGISLTETSQTPLTETSWTETPWIENHPWTETTLDRDCPGQRPGWTEKPWTEIPWTETSPGQRPGWTEIPQTEIIWTETPWTETSPGQKPPSDRHFWKETTLDRDPSPHRNPL